MRANFVTRWCPPEPAGRAYASAIGLTQRGHEVNVLTGFPNYPTGRLYDGYSLKPYSRERGTDGTTVHRVPMYPSHYVNAVERMGNYLSFMTSASVGIGLHHPLLCSQPSAPSRTRTRTGAMSEDEFMPERTRQDRSISGLLHIEALWSTVGRHAWCRECALKNQRYGVPAKHSITTGACVTE